jgi:hypothetical protein
MLTPLSEFPDRRLAIQQVKKLQRVAEKMLDFRSNESQNSEITYITLDEPTIPVGEMNSFLKENNDKSKSTIWE